MEVIVAVVILYFLFRFFKKSKSDPVGNENYRAYSARREPSWGDDDDDDNDYGWEEDDTYYGRSDPVEADFISPGGRTTVMGHQLQGGMIYVGKFGTRPHWGTPKSFINLDAKVATSGEDIAGVGMNYWPSYSTISPQCRLAYLMWLASGRRDPEYSIGYVFLFFYGLEWRLFNDQSLNDAPTLIHEVHELRKVYGDNRSFDRYSRSFLDMAVLLKDAEAGARGYEPMVTPYRSWEIPLNLRAAIGLKIQDKGAIQADLALDWWVASRERQLSPTIRRVFSELRTVFRLRFDAMHSDGLKFKPPKAKIKGIYGSASGDFKADISLELPDVRNLKGPLKKIDGLVQECIEALKGYSRAKAKAEDDEPSLEALALLPIDMSSAIPSLAADELRLWLKEISNLGTASVPVAEAFAKTGVELGENITPTKVRKVGSILRFAGYGMEPHPDFGGKCNARQNLIIYHDPGTGESVTGASEAYLGIAHTLTLSIAVANADGEISEGEKEHLIEMIRVEGAMLSLPEQRRLAAHLLWLIAYPPTWAALRSKLKKLPLEARRLMARFALATAAADGRIDPSEVKLLEQLYKLMEIDQGQLYTDLHAFESAPGTDQPISVKAAEPKSDYTIPAEPRPEHPKSEVFVLDMARIQQVRQDTHEVSKLLSEVFAEPESEADDEPDLEASVSTEDDREQFEGLDADHGMLLDELLARDEWPREDYERLCKEYGLMAEGALEAINDWAFDALDDILIEEGDPLIINKELLQGDST